MPDLRNKGGAGEQSCRYWPEISAETKQSEHGYSRSGATNLWCTTCQVLCAVCHPLDIKCLYWSVQSLFLCTEFMMHNSVQNGKKQSACISHWNRIVDPTSGTEWWALPWRTPALCFLAIHRNLYFFTCYVLQKKLWVFLKIVLKVVAHTDTNLLLLGIRKVRHVFRQSIPCSGSFLKCFHMLHMRLPTISQLIDWDTSVLMGSFLNLCHISVHFDGSFIS